MLKEIPPKTKTGRHIPIKRDTAAGLFALSPAKIKTRAAHPPSGELATRVGHTTLVGINVDDIRLFALAAVHGKSLCSCVRTDFRACLVLTGRTDDSAVLYPKYTSLRIGLQGLFLRFLMFRELTHLISSNKVHILK